MCIFFYVKAIDINGLTEKQIYYENDPVSTPLWVSSGRFSTVNIYI